MRNELAIIRAVHFAASLLPLSVCIVRALAGGGSAPAGSPELFERRLRRLMAGCFAAVFATGFLWLWYSIAGMSGLPLRESLDGGMFKMVLSQTAPGHVWLARAAVALAMACLAAIFRKSIPGRAEGITFHLFALLSVCLAGSLAWLGHAGAAEGPLADIHLGADVLHLLSAAAWPGGLVPFAILLGLLLQSREPDALAQAAVATRRFSAASLVAVGLLAGSGCVNGFFLVGGFQALASTEYGRLLLFKLCVFAVMIAIGANNLLVLKPRLANAPVDAAVAGRIARNVIIEAALAAVVLGIVGILGITPPGSHP